MSTPPATETFVTGDRVSYKNPHRSGHTFTGTILGPAADLPGWYRCTLDTYGDFKFVLPAEGMALIPSSVEENPLEVLARKLQEKIDEVQADIEDYHVLDSASYEFDAGFTAGLRMAINEIESLTSKLTKNPDE